MGIGKIFHREWSKQFHKYVGTRTQDRDGCAPAENSCVVGNQNSLVDGQVASEALKLIDKSPNSKPFALFVGFHRPHWKYSTTRLAYGDVNPLFEDIYEQTQQVQEEYNSLGPPDPQTNGAPKLTAAKTESTRKIPTILKAATRRKWVFASTQWMDECLGRLIRGLESRGIFDETVFVFTSDNGVMLFDRAQDGKSVLFNQARRVPLIIRHPEHRKSWGKYSGASVDLMDIFPTLMDVVDPFDNPQDYGLMGTSLLPIIKRLALPDGNDYRTSMKLGSITQETRCTRAREEILREFPLNRVFEGDFVACHQIDGRSNRAEVFGISFQTEDWSYIEWRHSKTSKGKRFPRWDSAGLWGRELYDFRGDSGKITMNGVEFESTNLAPCPETCYPRALRTDSFPEDRDGASYYSLKNDEFGIDFQPPDLEHVEHKYRDVVRRLSLALRSLVRDDTPICSNHGLANPRTGVCDQCIHGWHGSQCERPDYAELSTNQFPFDSDAPSISPTKLIHTPRPTREPTALPTKRPTKEPRTRVPTLWPTRRPTKTPVIRTKTPTAAPVPFVITTRAPTPTQQGARWRRNQRRINRKRRRQRKRRG